MELRLDPTFPDNDHKYFLAEVAEEDIFLHQRGMGPST